MTNIRSVNLDEDGTVKITIKTNNNSENTFHTDDASVLQNTFFQSESKNALQQSTRQENKTYEVSMNYKERLTRFGYGSLLLLVSAASATGFYFATKADAERDATLTPEQRADERGPEKGSPWTWPVIVSLFTSIGTLGCASCFFKQALLGRRTVSQLNSIEDKKAESETDLYRPLNNS